ncbi:MAG: choice-of-anchor J domain-containing protein, partial [Thermoplasmata archaeon]|nr:choice-of-anchor J domain-containing protein [Thermoplasmata archaeon]
MKKSLAMLLVLVMSISTMVAAIGSTNMTEQNDWSGTDLQDATIDRSNGKSANMDDVDPVTDYLRHLDLSGPRFPAAPEEGEPLLGDGPHPLEIDPYVDVILLHEDPLNADEWLPLPTRDDLMDGRVAPVTFENGMQVEIHGKLFERVPDITYLDDVGLPNMTLNITFDGIPIPGGVIDRTGNSSTYIDPFGENGNGTFQFLLDINKPAGEYELVVYFAGWPLTGEKLYEEMTYTAVVYVNHPTHIDVDVAPESVTVGDSITISGSVADDTGRPITRVPLQIRLDNELLGPSSDGVYIDDVEVQGASFSDDFEPGATNVWSTYTVPGRGVGNQWEQGSPGAGFGPSAPHSGSQLWGTVLNGSYQRGAWSFLVTPQLDFTANHDYTLSFWAWWIVCWNDDYAYVLATEDGGTTWDEASPMMFMDASLVSGDWNLIEYNVTKYGGSDDVRFAFVFYSIDKTLDVR